VISLIITSSNCQCAVENFGAQGSSFIKLCHVTCC